MTSRSPSLQPTPASGGDSSMDVEYDQSSVSNNNTASNIGTDKDVAFRVTSCPFTPFPQPLLFSYTTTKVSAPRSLWIPHPVQRPTSESIQIALFHAFTLSASVVLEATIRVDHLTKNVSLDHVQELFGVYGKIKSVNFPINPRFRSNMGFAEIEYETRDEAQQALAGWNGGQLDGEILLVGFATKITKVAVAVERVSKPVRANAPPASPPRRRARSPPPRRRNEDHYSPPGRRGNFDGPLSGRRDYFPPPPPRRRNDYSPPPPQGGRRNFNRGGHSPRRAQGVNAAPLGQRAPARGRSPLPPTRGGAGGGGRRVVAAATAGDHVEEVVE
ncbi:hypothetical protein BGZ99_003467 [Dissophora globulifera]|uniref:RRM domain-containing protein n=1 Tax=Dissophora globulifera TaxID=979702 RepID=A0A9P6RW70_9FUNG|nr:hypothetical protein BGZ99_003467 [Dissophora globulifera]